VKRRDGGALFLGKERLYFVMCRDVRFLRWKRFGLVTGPVPILLNPLC
jgi:hypothetical protein